MIQQLVLRYAAQKGIGPAEAALRILTSDPIDLVLGIEQTWREYLDANRPAAPISGLINAGGRPFLTGAGGLSMAGAAGARAWDHLGYAYVLENTRVVQIMRRVIREYRSGEALGVPSVWTQRWLDAAESLAFGAFNPLAGWLSTSAVRPDAEGVRRNAYWRLFGMDLAFGADDGRPAPYDKASVANTTFVPLFEELLYELWQAIANIRNTAGVNQADDDRIYRITEQLGYNLRSRRQDQMLLREELVAATVLGFFELSLVIPTPLIADLKAEGSSASERLRAIGDRVSMAPHSRSASFFSMAGSLSLILRAIEDPVVTGPTFASILYSTVPQNGLPALGEETRRVITEWSAATGKDLKTRARPVEVDSRRLVAVR